MILHCPCCHTRFPLEAALENGAARELMALLVSRPMDLARPLVSYLGLFRSRSRALSWDRALHLAWEVVELERDVGLLAAALAETVEAIHAKREHGAPRPLTNHNYLRRVLETRSARRPNEPRPCSETELAPQGEGPVHPDVEAHLTPMLDRIGRGMHGK